MKATDNLEVLIVDDDEMTVFLHEVYVKENEFHSSPKSFYNGADAVAFFDTYFNVSNHYCMLLDLNMPISNGWDVMDDIIKKGMDQNVSVVILTSSINKEDRIKAEKYDMVIDFIEKPLSIEHIKKIKALEKFQNFF